MNNSNSKILTLIYIASAALLAFTVYALVHALAGAFGFVARLSNYDLFKHGLPFVIAVATFFYLQFNKKVSKWADEVISEVKKVVWPKIKDTRVMTVVVIVMVFISSVVISVFDIFSAFSINQLIK